LFKTDKRNANSEEVTLKQGIKLSREFEGGLGLMYTRPKGNAY